MSTRPPAVAGTFYPADPMALRKSVGHYLEEARKSPRPRGPMPKALIVPHAGFVYSGSVAARAYALLEPHASRVRRVVLIGPSHRVAFRGLAVPTSAAFDTPLGPASVDSGFRDALVRLPFVSAFDEAHRFEHSLEVQLPFLQSVLNDFEVMPVTVGDASPHMVAEVLDACWDDERTVIIVSTDLSHYLDYEGAKRRDGRTARAIERLDPESISEMDACGRRAVQGVLEIARRRGLSVEPLDLRSSGDTAGPRDEVVGYGAWAFFQR